MKTPQEVANHPRAVLVRRMVNILRAAGSVPGTEQPWRRVAAQRVFWKRLEVYGLTSADGRAQLTQIAFPAANRAEVDLALEAGNKLRQIHELAGGGAGIAHDGSGRAKLGRKGLKVIRKAGCNRASD